MASTLQRRFAATAILAALSLPVLAQQPAVASPAASAKATAPQGRHERHERHHGDMAQYHAKHLADLKAQLKLTAAQEPAWTSFTTAMQPDERPARLDRLDRKEMDKLTTPERIDRMRALRAQHAAEADRRGEATKTFYATLTPEQQKTFDAQAHRGMRMGGMKGMDGMKGAEGHRRGQHDHRGDMHRGGEGKPGMGPAKMMPAPAPAPAPASK
ncbi:Spy/CpxP family protein refolding chaperone [Acidovorax radicis]|uniref:Spy/CpxP family protein refolding chaperone n=1 Tax=Acidovorax radicis TaxID=758826 RepID=UPI001CF91D56|nr:Spy/CpxP family protein refolding chaperone [Acidovorax radicis]UCU99302.1 Spy/CpxP family protein refolding chaperone [Acidovorax radicis]